MSVIIKIFYYQQVSIIPFGSNPLTESEVFGISELDELIEEIRNLSPVPAQVLKTSKSLVHAVRMMRKYGRPQSKWNFYLVSDARPKVNLISLTKLLNCKP